MMAARPTMITTVSPMVHGSTTSACHRLRIGMGWLNEWEKSEAVSDAVRELGRAPGTRGDRARRVRQPARGWPAAAWHQRPRRRELVGGRLARTRAAAHAAAYLLGASPRGHRSAADACGRAGRTDCAGHH